jgi:ribosome-associated toxin RatA of RatAB toxin-antitoxin module
MVESLPMRRFVFVLIAALLLPFPIGAVKQIKLGSLIGRVDFESLVPLLEKGELSLVESYRSGRLWQVTVVALVKASPDRVWRVLTDYQNYVKFMPNLDEIEITKRQGADVHIAYELEVPGPNMDYTLIHHHVPKTRIDITLADDEGDIQTGAWRWELIPHQNGGQTILVYSLYTDVRESSWVLRQIMKSQPSLEHGLNVATGLVTVRAIKKRAEK